MSEVSKQIIICYKVIEILSSLLRLFELHLPASTIDLFYAFMKNKIKVKSKQNKTISEPETSFMTK